MYQLTYVALFGFPLLSMLLFLRFGVQRGIVWTVMLGFLFLPLQPTFDLPLLPEVNRTTLSVLCAVLFAMFMMRGRGWTAQNAGGASRSWLPRSRVALAFVAIALVSPVFTVLTNLDSGGSIHGYLLPVSLTDIGGLTYEILFQVILLLLGRRLLSDQEGLLTLLKAVGILGIVYGVLIVIEWRLSPMMKFWVYGIWDINWALVTRGDAFRPVVFMENGLQTAIFQSMACICAIAVFRHSKGGDRTLWRMISLFNLACLPFTQSMAAVVLGFGFSLIVFFGLKRHILIIVALIAASVFTYPVLRALHVVPTQQILAVAGSVSEARAASLGTRFTSEDRYIDRALYRPFFGWAQRQREMPRNAEGKAAAIPDGNWNIIIAQRGFVAFFAIYGLFTLPTIVLWLKRRVAPIDHIVLGLALAICVALIDKLLNSFFTPVLWLGSGALLGVTERVVFKESNEAAEQRRAALEMERRKRRGQTALGQTLGDNQPTGGRGQHGLAHARR
ncbi:MAG: hypothetical protein AAFU72_09225 [Pseudomonadota bacterium]